VSGAGLGFLNFLALRHLGSAGRYANATEKITISSRFVDKFMKICAVIPSTGQDGYKKSKLSEVNPGRAVAKPVFDLYWTRLPHNLG
jgi:hypothetical protein